MFEHKKSDIIRASYELFDLLMRPYVCLPDLGDQFAISIMSLTLIFKISIFQFAYLNIKIQYHTSELWAF